MLAGIPRSGMPTVDPTDNLKDGRTDSDVRFETKISDAFAHLVVGEHNSAALTTNHAFSSSDDANLRIVVCVDKLPIEESVPRSAHTLIFPSEPDVIGGQNALSYMQELQKRWIKPSLSTHLWILSNALTGSKDITFSAFTRYIAATSYKRIACRFNNKFLSVPFLDSLKKVDEIPFTSDVADGKPHEADRLFLRDCVEYRTKLDVEIPNLIEMHENMPPAAEAFRLYTNETRIEFHHLILKLLDQFKTALDNLVALNYDEATEASDQAVEEFNQNVDHLNVTGYLLFRMSKTHAFQKHLENIKYKLRKPRISPAEMSIEERDRDGDLEVIHSNSLKKTLLRSYLAWLRLMVSHIDAARIVIIGIHCPRFVYKSISVEVMVIPQTDSSLLPWSEVFKEFIPELSPLQLYYDSRYEIIKFLEKGISDSANAKDATDQCQDAMEGLDNPGPQLVSGELSDSDRFFLNLNNLSFRGTNHCETFLASLLAAFDSDNSIDGTKDEDWMQLLSQMQGFGRVIGVSKICCLTCAVVLKHLRYKYGDVFFVQGDVGVYSACSLPLWTPSYIVDSINADLGCQLSRNLTHFMRLEEKKHYEESVLSFPVLSYGSDSDSE
ncbi:hypothetical protein BDN70DRAFT_640415 [Pholiota conissans]|uniref:Uncharacterized protein n=1 Tax=Pholiota conissans TaxID=109636 RepID=A0A9P5Z3H7_9AGAR|nr:hypothetical protein BDN70DRAFT_640415 [Pholiota conissans]